MSKEIKEQVEQMEKEGLTLDYLILNNLPIWVRNSTHTLPGVKASGVITMEIIRSNGSHGKEEIQPGSDPVCLTDKHSRESLKNCDNLFRLIDDGALELLHPEDAREYYKESKERRRLAKEKRAKMGGIRTIQRPQRSQNPEEFFVDKNDTVLAREPKRINPASTGLHPRVGSLCNRAKSTGPHSVDEVQMLEDLREQEGSFSNSDFEYLKVNGYFQSVKDWADEKLNK